MNFGQKLIFAVLGSILTIVGMLFSPFQKSRFGEIECTKLRIVNEDGKNRVVLATRETGGGRLSVYDEDENIAINLGVLESGGYVGIFHRDKLLAKLSVLDNGGVVSVKGKDGKSNVRLGIGKLGGNVDVLGKDDKSSVTLGIGKLGGNVNVLGKDDKCSVTLGITKHGGHTLVDGRDGKSWVALSVGEHGGIIGIKGKDGKSKTFTP